MSRALSVTFCVLCADVFGSALGSAQVAGADEPMTARAAMRTAAEAVAEVEPGLPPHLDSMRGKNPRGPKPSAAQVSSRDSLQAAVREAVNAELAREVAVQERQGGGRGQSPGKATGASDNGKDASDQAHRAALQAQGAKVVGAQHSQGVAKAVGMVNGVGSGDGDGNANAHTDRHAGAVTSAVRAR